ncbi:MAG: GNAT family N-acetyltransferase, partial [Pseudomonadota bacterium]
MTPIVDADGWALDRATPDDIETLKRWFPDDTSVRVWGGPNFRAPFTSESFAEDCHWPAMDSFCLREPDGESGDTMVAFGQLYDRNGRINLARLIAHPERRGQGIGRRLVGLLMVAGARLLPLKEYSLFVYRDNRAALACYQAMGFEINPDYPED